MIIMLLQHDFAPIPDMKDNLRSKVLTAESTSLTVNMNDKYIITFRGCAELFGHDNFQYYTQDSSMDLLQIKNMIHSFMIDPFMMNLLLFYFTWDNEINDQEQSYTITIESYLSFITRSGFTC